MHRRLSIAAFILWQLFKICLTLIAASVVWFILWRLPCLFFGLCS